MTLDIQWFIFALVSNEVLTYSEAKNIYNQLKGAKDLTDYAQVVLDKLVDGLSQEDAQSVFEQINSVIEFATGQAATGIAPELPDESAPAKTKGAPAPAAEDDDDEEAKAAKRIAANSGKRTGLVEAGSTTFEARQLDLSGINSYEDLPSLKGIAQVSDAEAAETMIYLLSCLRKLGASDLHLSAMSPPFVRRKLKIERFAPDIITPEDAIKLNMALLSPERREMFLNQLDMNLAIEVGSDRFRVALMMQKDGMAGSYRLVPDHICSLEELGFMEHDIVTIKRMLDYHNGLVLVTGPIGAGKTTSLAAMVDVINQKRTDHVITVEDPIEIIQLSKGCQVTQREIGKHTISYRTALKAALREDPDVIVIGEMHDLETIENAITASETGHLVIGTLHTSDAANTLNRLLDVFPPTQQAQIRAMTAGSLRGIICQRLIPALDGGLTVAYEILTNTMSVANTISEGKSFRLKGIMQTGSKQGMCTFDQCLFDKYKKNMVDYDVALGYMRDASVIAQIKQEWAMREAQKLNKGK